MEGPERWNCMIAWKYLNKPSATVAALQDYATMRDIINITPQETKELYDRMISTGGRQLTGLRKPAGKMSGYAGCDTGAIPAGSGVHELV